MRKVDFGHDDHFLSSKLFRAFGHVAECDKSYLFYADVRGSIQREVTLMTSLLASVPPGFRHAELSILGPGYQIRHFIPPHIVRPYGI